MNQLKSSSISVQGINIDNKIEMNLVTSSEDRISVS